MTSNFAKVFKVQEGSHVGLVDGNVGNLKYMDSKPVMLCWFSNDIGKWYKYLKEKGAKLEQPPQKQGYLDMKTMLFRDSEDYILEILQWIKKPYES